MVDTVEIGEQQRDEGLGNELGHAPAPGRMPAQRTGVGTLHHEKAGTAQQRPEEPGDVVGGEVLDVLVQIDDVIPPPLGCRHGLTLAEPWPADDGDSVTKGLAAGAVPRAIVDDEDLVYETSRLEQVSADARHDGTDRSHLVPGRNADQDPCVPLCGHELADLSLCVLVGRDRPAGRQIGLDDCHLRADDRG